MFLWMIFLPITFNWMSPYLIIQGGFEGYITMSFVVFSVWFASSLFLGRAYCAYGCQWGAGQEILGEMISKKLHPKRKYKFRKIKYGVFAVWIVFVALGPIFALGYPEGLNLFYPSPSTDISGLFSFDIRVLGQLAFYFGIIASVILLFTLIGGSRSFCNYACPMAVLGIIGTKIKNILKFPSLHLESNVEKCTKCKQCSKACPMSLDVMDLVQSGKMYDPDCILCGNCINICPQDVIEYAWKWNKKIKDNASK
jgi:polyferredoxin